MKKQLINTWDYQWTFTLWNNSQLNNTSKYKYDRKCRLRSRCHAYNRRSELANLKAYELELKTHPKEVKRDFEADKFTSKIVFEKKSLIIRLINKLSRIIISKNIIK